MDGKQIARAFLAGIEAGSVDAVGQFVADDAVCTGALPYPVGKEPCLRVWRALVAGMPDLRFNAANWDEVGNRVEADVQITGVQSAVLPPLLPSLPPVLATGRHISLPRQHVDFHFQGDKIDRIDLEPVAGGSVQGVLAQLGIRTALAV